MDMEREMFLFKETDAPSARLKAIGVGGGGSNAINTMVASGLLRVDFIAANTDIQALGVSIAPSKIQLGKVRTKGLGAGSNPEVGRESAIEQADEIRQVLDGADMVFVTAGLGGGTGTGAAPIIAGIARELGALTVAVVTKPFQFEGGRRSAKAAEGLEELKKCTDTLLVIPNQRILSLVDKTTPLPEAFKVANNVLRQAIQGIAEVITTPGLVNVDFADVRTVMGHMGRAVMGMGRASGPERAASAARSAIASPLLEDGSIEGARGLLLNITGGSDLSLHEVDEAASIIHEETHENANIIFGAVIDPGMMEEVCVTVIATGFEVESDEIHVSQRLISPVRVREIGSTVSSDSRVSAHRTAVARRGSQARLPLMDDDWEVPTFIRKHTS